VLGFSANVNVPAPRWTGARPASSNQKQPTAGLTGTISAASFAAMRGRKIRFHVSRLFSISMEFFHLKNSSGNLDREWTLMDANNLGGDFIRGRALCVHDLSSADCRRQHVISSRALACIRGLQNSGFHRSIRAMPSLRDLPASSL